MSALDNGNSKEAHDIHVQLMVNYVSEVGWISVQPERIDTNHLEFCYTVSKGAVDISYTGKISICLTASVAIRPHNAGKLCICNFIGSVKCSKWYSWEAYQKFGAKVQQSLSDDIHSVIFLLMGWALILVSGKSVDGWSKETHITRGQHEWHSAIMMHARRVQHNRAHLGYSKLLGRWQTWSEGLIGTFKRKVLDWCYIDTSGQSSNNGPLHKNSHQSAFRIYRSTWPINGIMWYNDYEEHSNGTMTAAQHIPESWAVGEHVSIILVTVYIFTHCLYFGSTKQLAKTWHNS